jgi:hypothetical protein
MNSYVIGMAFILGVLGMGTHGQEPSKDGVQRLGGPSTTLTTNELLLPVLEVLHSAKVSGSMEFSGHCASFAHPGYPELPHPHGSAMSDVTPLQTVRRLYDDGPRMEVTQDPGGTIRMIENGVPEDILNVQISHISFDNGRGNGISNANAAVRLIVRTPEVSQFMDAHDIEWPFHGGEVVSGIIGGIPPPSPLSGSMDHVTVKEVLDRILKAFPGLWIYENCPPTVSRKRTIYFEFYELLYFPLRPTVG